MVREYGKSTKGAVLRAIAWAEMMTGIPYTWGAVHWRLTEDTRALHCWETDGGCAR